MYNNCIYLFIFSMEEDVAIQLQKSVEIFEGVETSLKCPRRYVSFIQTFVNIFGKNMLNISERQERIQVLICFYFKQPSIFITMIYVILDHYYLLLTIRLA